jgi:hypothetical protein
LNLSSEKTRFQTFAFKLNLYRYNEDADSSKVFYWNKVGLYKLNPVDR